MTGATRVRIRRPEIGRTWSVAAPWVVTAAVLAALALAIGVAGGWAKAPDDQGPDLGPATSVDLTRWRVDVGPATLVNKAPLGYDTADTIQIPLTLTNRTDASLYQPDTGVLEIVTPPGGQTDQTPTLRFSGDLPSSFDPDIPRAAMLQLVYPEGVRAPDVTSVTLVIRDEVESGGFLTRGDYRVGQPAGHLVLPCRDDRHG